jgi:DNA-directed RNA polymerase subunit H (RpoH/RPB5)
MAYGFVIPAEIDATDRRTLTRNAVHSTVDLENGSVVRLLTKSATAGEAEVWVATQAAGGAGLQNLWMVYEPEIPFAVSGTSKYKGLDPDPRNHINYQDTVFTAFKPQVGDIIWLNDDAITGVKGGNTYVVATAADWFLNWAGAAVAGLSLKLLGTKSYSIPDGGINAGRITMYEFEVEAIA